VRRFDGEVAGDADACRQHGDKEAGEHRHDRVVAAQAPRPLELADRARGDRAAVAEAAQVLAESLGAGVALRSMDMCEPHQQIRDRLLPGPIPRT
jgi:hypothetical protein